MARSSLPLRGCGSACSASPVCSDVWAGVAEVNHIFRTQSVKLFVDRSKDREWTLVILNGDAIVNACPVQGRSLVAELPFPGFLLDLPEGIPADPARGVRTAPREPSIGRRTSITQTGTEAATRPPRGRTRWRCACSVTIGTSEDPRTPDPNAGEIYPR